MTSVRIVNRTVRVVANDLTFNGESVATQSFVDAAVAGVGTGGGGGTGGIFTVVDTKTANFNVLSSDDKTIFFVDTGLGSTQVVVNLPLSPADGFIVRIASTGNNSWATNSVLVQAPVGQNISSGNSSNEFITLDGTVGFVDLIFDVEASTFSKFVYKIPTGDFKADGSVPMTGQLLMGSNPIGQVGSITATGPVTVSGHITAEGTVTGAIGVYGNEIYAYTNIASEGTGNFGGPVEMNLNKITGLGAPTLGTDAANRSFVESSIAAIPPAASSGVNDTLSNLSATQPVSFNKDLLPNVDGDRSIGSPSLQLGSIYAYGFYGGFGSHRAYISASGNGADQALSNQSIPAFTGMPYITSQTSDLAISSGVSSPGAPKSVYIVTGNRVDGAVDSGRIVLATGNGINSGNLEFKTGGATSGVRGKISLDAVLNLPVQTAPTTPVNGDMWFDGTNLNLRVAGVTRTVNLT